MVGTLVGECWYAVAWCDLDLTFYLPVMTLSLVRGYMCTTSSHIVYSESLLIFVLCNFYVMVLKTISLGCGVWTSLILFSVFHLMKDYDFTDDTVEFM